MRRFGRTDLSRVARPRSFVWHTILVGVVGGLLLICTLVRIFISEGVPRADEPGPWLILGMCVVEGLHIGLTRRGIYVPGATPTVALCFALTLVHGWPVGALWQSVAVVISGLLRRETSWRIAYTVGNYVLAYFAAGMALLAFGISPGPHTSRPLDIGDLPAVTVAGLVLIGVTQSSGWMVRASWRGVRLRTIVRKEIRSRIVSHGAFLTLAPLIAVVCHDHPWLLPLFAFPLHAAHRSILSVIEQEQQSRHDPLTKLPNRRLLVERAERATGDASARGGQAALIVLDLHRFHQVNDTLGHLAGDRLLKQVAKRLRDLVPPGATVARLGADEFAVLLTGETEDRPAALGRLGRPRSAAGHPPGDLEDTARALAQQLVDALAEPFRLDELTLDTEACAGLAVFPDHAHDVPALLQYADVAMYLAKRSTRGVEVYETARDDNTRERLLLLGDLRRALDAGQVELHYQPKVAFADGRVDGLEALVRWKHPERGHISPEEFVRLAEQTGLMPRLTGYVIDLALAQIARWRQEGIEVPVAVNISARDVHAPAFADSVAARLARHGVPPHALHLEITERVLIEEPLRAAEALSALRDLGVLLSLDDFGTGYSSLVHLRHIPVGEIKIDRSFVARLVHDAEDEAIVRSTVDLAHSLGLRVVAEGVEDVPTYERLRDLGCDSAQGWLVSKALPGDEATAWLLRHGVGEVSRPARRCAVRGSHPESHASTPQASP
jgi:predicted signal transduction protein with EAL and GGDEF domain